MSSISCVMYVRDEAPGIERAIRSVVEWVEELVVWDTGSKDQTVDIVRPYADRLYRLMVPPEAIDFGEIETMVCHLAACDWVLRLDGDETLENGHVMQDLIELESEDYGAWKFPRYRWGDWDKTIQLEKNAFPDWQARLFLNDKRSRYTDALHPRFETPHLVGETFKVWLNHFTDVYKLNDPKRLAERNALYERLARQSGKEPEGSAEGMRLAGHN